MISDIVTQYLFKTWLSDSKQRIDVIKSLKNAMSEHFTILENIRKQTKIFTVCKRELFQLCYKCEKSDDTSRKYFTSREI